MGDVQIDKLYDFWAIFEKLLEDVKLRKGDKRSAARNEQGHQKTPTMIQAVLLDALADLVRKTDLLTPARGGFTDVGLHTGGHARNTTWPLVIAVLQIILESAGYQNLCCVAIAFLKLTCVEKMVSLLVQENKFCQNTIMQMLKATVIDGQKLTAPCFEFDIRGFESRCLNIRSWIDKKVLEFDQYEAKIFMLPE